MAAERLVRTETTYVTNMAELESYKELDIDKYIFVATLDLRTSPMCREMDGKIIEVSKGASGENLLPLHHWCRSTTRAYFEGMTRKRRARDPETGENYIIEDMEYKEWYQKCVVDKYGEQKAETFQKMIKNKGSDRKQYAKYKEILGKDMPKSFDDFQNLKYNNTESWEQKKRQYSTWNRINSDNSKSDEYKAKMKETYKYFKDNGYEFTSHGINRFLGQRQSKGKRVISKEETLEILNKSKNYVQSDGNFVRFYDNMAIISASDTNEVISIISRPKPKTEWKEL